MAKLLPAGWFGRLTDRVGKVRAFRVSAVLVVLPLVATTLTAGLPIWAVLPVCTAFFALRSARMVPGMAIPTSTANPDLRGTFMKPNSALQSVAKGATAFIGDNTITRDSLGPVQHCWVAATVDACASLATVWVAGRLDLHNLQPPGCRPVPLLATLPGPPEHGQSAPALRRNPEKTGLGLRLGIAFV